MVSSNVKGFDYSVKVVMLGNFGSGKTSLHQVFYYGQLNSDYGCLIQPDFFMKVYTMNDNKRLRLMVWDTASQERFNHGKMIPSYYRGAVAAIVVFDITDFESFRAVAVSWLKDLKEACKATASIFLVGNKSDCEEKRAVKRD